MRSCLVNWKVGIDVTKTYHFVSLSQYCTQYSPFFPCHWSTPQKKPAPWSWSRLLWMPCQQDKHHCLGINLGGWDSRKYASLRDHR